MPRITIKSPDDIRREVNAVKQQHRRNSSNASGNGSSSGGLRYSKRRTLYTDLTIDFGGCPRERVLQASDLATLIECAPGGRLESLSLEHVKIVGEFSEVLEALRQSAAAQHLKTFSSYACRLRESVPDMIALGEALATLPRLQGVSLGLSFMKHQPAWKILTPVVQNCKNLNKIFVNGFYAPSASDSDDNDNDNNESDQQANQEVVTFFEACANSRSIKRLLCLPMLGRSFGTSSIMQALGQVIRQNKSLQTLELYILNGTNVIELAEDLKHNSTLERLALTGRQAGGNGVDTEAEMQAFYHALRDHNYTLQELLVEPWNNARSPELDFELSLNRMGRNKLLNHGASTDEWMEAIANKDDISAIFYFLRKNPNLCDPKMWTGPNNNADQQEDDEDDADNVLVIHPSATGRAAAAAAVAAMDMFSALSDQDVLASVAAGEAQPRGGGQGTTTATNAAVVSPETQSTVTSRSGNSSNSNMMDSPLAPRILHQERERTRQQRRQNRKRSRDEMEQDDDDRTTTTSSNDAASTTIPSHSPTSSTSSNSTLMGVVTTTAYTAAVFAAGYWFRGASVAGAGAAAATARHL